MHAHVKFYDAVLDLSLLSLRSLQFAGLCPALVGKFGWLVKYGRQAVDICGVSSTHCLADLLEAALKRLTSLSHERIENAQLEPPTLEIGQPRLTLLDRHLIDRLVVALQRPGLALAFALRALLMSSLAATALLLWRR